MSENDHPKTRDILQTRILTRILLILPLILLRFFLSLIAIFIGVILNASILFQGKRNVKIFRSLIKINSKTHEINQHIFFQLEDIQILAFEQEIEISEEQLLANRKKLLIRISGLILFLQTRIIYISFLLINWTIYTTMKLFKTQNETILSFIQNSIEDIHNMNLYLTGCTDHFKKWESLEDIITGVFFVMLTHGFILGYWFLYVFIVILDKSGSPMDIFYSVDISTLQLLHAMIIAIFLYSLFFFIKIPYFLRYPKREKSTKITGVWKDLGLSIRHPLRDLLIIIFVLGFYYMLACGILIELFKEGSISLVNRDSFLEELLTMGIFWGFSEEVVFRGYMLTNLQRKINIILAIFLSSFFFSLYHIAPSLIGFWFDWTQLVVTFFLGIILAVFRWKSTSIWGAVIIHTLYNSINLQNFSNCARYSILTHGWEVKWSIIILPVVLLIMLIYPGKKKEEKTQEKKNGI